MVNTCVCVMCLCLQFKGFLCVHMFASSQWGENHCVLGEPACARVYSKVDYVFGSVLLTITKSFCFGENSTRKPVSLLSLCRRSASINPIASLVLVDGPEASSCQDQTSWLHKQEWRNKREDGSFFNSKHPLCFSAV